MIIKQFSEMPISEEIKHAISDIGFEEATGIQAESIPLILSGKDVIGHSHTGTGKTAAFSIPAIEIIDKALKKATQILILCPTRELAIQACDEIKKLTKYKRFIKTVPIYGGQPIERQFEALKGGAQIIVGTPGRVMDHMRRKTISFSHLKMVILDEADEMLSMGFREDIETILKDVPEERQTILFSATMSDEIMEITKLYQHEPEIVKITREEITVPNIDQYYYEIPAGKKTEALSRLLDRYNPSRSIVFCNTKKQVGDLAEELSAMGYCVGGLHGDMKQNDRTRIMNGYRKGKISILIATDVAARGIDVDDVEAVFNYDIPQDLEYYVHRIGRTGRIGKQGTAYTFVCGRRQIYELHDIEKYTKSKIHLMRIPTSDELSDVLNVKLTEEISKTIEEGGLEEFNEILDSLFESYSSVEICGALIKKLIETGSYNTHSKHDDIAFEEEGKKIRLTMNRRSDSDRDRRGRSQQGDRRKQNTRSAARAPRREHADESGMDKISINVGKKHRVSAAHILGAVAGESGLPGKTFGRIEILESCTIVSVPKENTKKVLDAMKGCKIMGYKTVTRKL